MMTKLSIAAAVLFLFISCQRSLDYTLDSLKVKPDYHVSFKANGLQKNYSGATLASFAAQDSMYNCNLLMAVAPSTTADRVMIALQDTRAFTTLTKYTDEIVKDRPQATILYTDGTGKQYSSAITIGPAYVTVMLTENAADHVSGTFSGLVQNADDIAAGNTGNAINITQGIFILKK